MLSSAAGGYSAVIALVAKTEASSAPSELLFATAASVGIALSWLLLQVGFANIYRYICIDSDGEAIQKAGTAIPAPIDYMCFSLTIGATFATSDAAIPALRVRRIVAVHSVVSFFYNALVVAVAFQVLQSAVSG